MADPSAIIVALHGLAEKLVTNIKSGQDAAKAQEILRLVGELQTEFFALQSRILKLEAENFQLKQKASPLQPTNPPKQDDNKNVVVDLDEISTKILQVVANSQGGAQKEELFAHFSLSVGRGDFVFEGLTGHEFIEIGRFNLGGGGAYYFATTKGRAYLNNKGLL
jgi:hypothetical protein